MFQDRSVPTSGAEDVRAGQKGTSGEPRLDQFLLAEKESKAQR